MDRIYGATTNTSWRWIEATPDPSLFTGQAASDPLPVVVKIEGIEEGPPTKAEAEIKSTTLQLPNIRAAIHHIWRSVYEKYPTKEYGQAAVWTRAKQTISTFILDCQRHSGRETHPLQDLKTQIKIAYIDASTLPPSQQRIHNIKAPADKFQKSCYEQRKSANTAANKAAHNEGQPKQFYKKYRPSLKTGGIASLYNTPNWDDPDTKNDPSTKTEDMREEAANYYQGSEIHNT
jgi:hypothetical protein